MTNNNSPYPPERSCTYMIPYNQLSLADIFSACQDIYESDKPQFLSLLQQHIDLDELVPASFRKHFYASTGRSRKYPLNAFLWALIIQRIFSIPTDSLLLVFLLFQQFFDLSGQWEETTETKNSYLTARFCNLILAQIIL